jgi:hypothetical protein
LLGTDPLVRAMSKEGPDPIMVTCPSCRGRFASYKPFGYVECPRCGRQVRVGYASRIVRIVGLVLLAAVLVGLALYFWRAAR